MKECTQESSLTLVGYVTRVSVPAAALHDTIRYTPERNLSNVQYMARHSLKRESCYLMKEFTQERSRILEWNILGVLLEYWTWQKYETRWQDNPAVLNCVWNYSFSVQNYSSNWWQDWNTEGAVIFIKYFYFAIFIPLYSICCIIFLHFHVFLLHYLIIFPLFLQFIYRF